MIILPRQARDKHRKRSKRDRFVTKERSTKEKLAKKFGVTGIPCLVILDAETAAVCTKNGERKRLKTAENGRFEPLIVLMLVLSLSWRMNRNYDAFPINRPK